MAKADLVAYRVRSLSRSRLHGIRQQVFLAAWAWLEVEEGEIF